MRIILPMDPLHLHRTEHQELFEFKSSLLHAIKNMAKVSKRCESSKIMYLKGVSGWWKEYTGLGASNDTQVPRGITRNVASYKWIVMVTKASDFIDPRTGDWDIELNCAAYFQRRIKVQIMKNRSFHGKGLKLFSVHLMDLLLQITTNFVEVSVNCSGQWPHLAPNGTVVFHLKKIMWTILPIL